MKRKKLFRSALIALLLLLLQLPMAMGRNYLTQEGDNSNDAQTVKKLEREWLDAYEKRDPAAMDRIVGNDFIITFPDGAKQTKTQIMTMVKSQQNSTQPSPKFHTENVTARVYGDVVILTGIVVTTFQQNGKEVIDRSRYTDVYYKKNNRWQVVSSHLSNATK